MTDNPAQVLDAYCQHLNLGKNPLSLASVTYTIQKHLSDFPFTSIPVLLGEDISLNLGDIVDKIVISGRGGYCFEHNKLFFNYLKSLDMNVTPHLARMILNRSEITPRTHRISILGHKGNRYLIDVGNSYFSPPVPVNINGEETTTQLGRVYRVSEISRGTYALELVLPDEVFTIYHFDFNEYHEVDFELSNFYSCRHPHATFVNNLVISKIFPDEIRSMRYNTYYRIFSQKTLKTTITDLEQFGDILKNDFDYPVLEEEISLLFNKFITT